MISTGKSLKRITACREYLNPFLQTFCCNNMERMEKFEWLEKLNFMVEKISNLNLIKNKLQGKLNECVITDVKIKKNIF